MRLIAGLVLDTLAGSIKERAVGGTAYRREITNAARPGGAVEFDDASDEWRRERRPRPPEPGSKRSAIRRPEVG
jgi:hypothetical protein